MCVVGRVNRNRRGRLSLAFRGGVLRGVGGRRGRIAGLGLALGLGLVGLGGGPVGVGLVLLGRVVGLGRLVLLGLVLLGLVRLGLVRLGLAVGGGRLLAGGLGGGLGLDLG